MFKIWQPEAEELFISGLSVLVQDSSGATFKGGLLWLGLLVSFHTHALSKCFELVLLKIGEKPL